MIFNAKSLLVVVLAMGASGCSNWREWPIAADHTLFSHLGGTVFTSPEQMTMKEIHLDNGSLLGRDIIVEGAVSEVSEYYTYVVISDETARMLVVLTNLEEAAPMLQKKDPNVIRVLGTVESGKKGLPYLRARALNVLSAPEGV